MFKKRAESEADVYNQPSGLVSNIAAGMCIHGDVDAEGDMRIDGKVEGNIFCKGKVVLGSAGIVDGDIHVATADIFGKVNGNIHVKDLLCLKTKCLINGNLFVGGLHIEPNAVFNGQCQMGDNKNPTQAVTEAKNILASTN